MSSEQRWAILYRPEEASPMAPPECFNAKARDSDHAEEQCEDANPGCDVLWTFPGSPAAAFADYWDADHHDYYECGICGRIHPWSLRGDQCDDASSFTADQLPADARIASMENRAAADER